VLSSTQEPTKRKVRKSGIQCIQASHMNLLVRQLLITRFAENFLEAKQSTTNYDLISAVKKTEYFLQLGN